MDNKAMNKLSYGLFVVTVRCGGKQNGCITNTAAQVTTDPNRILQGWSKKKIVEK